MQASQYQRISHSQSAFIQFFKATIRATNRAIQKRFFVPFALMGLSGFSYAQTQIQNLPFVNPVFVNFESQKLNLALQKAIQRLQDIQSELKMPILFSWSGQIYCDTTRVQREKCQISVPTRKNGAVTPIVLDMPDSDQFLDLINEETIIPIQNGLFRTVYDGRTDQSTIRVTIGYGLDPRPFETALDMITPKDEAPEVDTDEQIGNTYSLECSDGACIIMKDPSRPGFQLEPELAEFLMRNLNAKEFRAVLLSVQDKANPQDRTLGISATVLQRKTPLN